MALAPDDFSADTTTTGKLSIGSGISANFENGEDSDWFAVTLQAGVNYLFTLNRAGSQYRLALYDAYGSALLSPQAGGYIAAAAIEYQAAVTGTYYVAASSTYSYYGSNGPYQLSVAERTASDDYPASAASPAAISVGGTVSGQFEVAGDRDWFKFHADLGVHYQFGANPMTPESVPVDFADPEGMRIMDLAGNEVAAFGWQFDPIVSGDYYLDVLGLSIGKYTIVSKTWNDDFSPHNNTLGKLAPGGTLTAEIQFDSDVDRFKVSLEADQYYTFTLSGDNSMFGMNLRDANGKSIHWISSSGNGLRLTSDPLAAGDYYLDVSHATGFFTQTKPVPYSLALSVGTRDDIGNVAASAKTTAVGVTASGSLQNSADVDMFKVDLQAGTTYAFALKPDNALAHELQLTFSRLNGVVLETATATDVGYYTFTPAVSGDYYAAVGTKGGVTPNYAYSLAVTKPVDDYGASMAGAGTLVIGGSVSGKLETGGGDRDLFAVNLTAGSSYWFSSKSTDAFFSGGQVRLLDAAGNELALAAGTRSNIFAETISYLANKTGTYYLEVSSTTRTVQSYTIQAAVGVNDDVGNTPASAATLSPAATFTGTLELSSDKDVFKLSVVAGRTYAIEALGVANGGSPNVALVDRSGKDLDYSAWKLQTGRDIDQFTAAVTGDVYAVVSGGSDYGPTRYTLKEYDYGVDDYAASAQTTASLVMGGSLQGALSDPFDRDWIRVKLEAGRSYVFQLLGAASGGGTLGASATPYFGLSNDYNTPAPTQLKSGVEQRLAFTPSNSGDYFLNVGVNSNWGMGSYTLKAVQLSGDASGPGLIASTHAAGATGIALNNNTIRLSFSEAITVDKTAISVADSQGVKVNIDTYGDDVRANDNQLIIKLSDFFKPGSYTLSLPQAAVHDLAGNQHTGPQSITFSTAPAVTAGTGANDVLSGGTGLTFDGGAGIDTVRYAGWPGSYTIRRDGGTVTVSSFSTKTDTLQNVERLIFDRDSIALDIDGNGGQAYRLYQAAFDRVPDGAGLGYWIAQLDKGISLHDIAAGFVASAEFIKLYGATPSNHDYVNLLYMNVLNRPAEGAGLTFWLDALNKGVAREDVLMHFSESPENKAALVGVMDDGFAYTSYFG